MNDAREVMSYLEIKGGPKDLGRFFVSQNKVFTPVEKFDESTIGMRELSEVMRDRSSAEWPVVPMTIALPCWRRARRSRRSRCGN